MNQKILIILLTITFLGGMLRFIGIGEIPNGLNVDEVAIGYDAYSMLKTGKDMNGSLFPVTFPSLGDYKAPFYIYLTSISVYLFGLNEFAVRFMSAFFGTIAVFTIYFLTNAIFKNYKLALLSAAFLAVSPWHIFYSRIVSESQVATCLVIIGLYALIKFKTEKWFWGYVAAILLSASMYTYHTQRLFVPLLLLVWAINNRKWLIFNRIKLLPLIVVGLMLVVPLVTDLVFGKGSTRASQQSIFNDENFLRQVAVEPLNSGRIWFNNTYQVFNQNWILIIFFSIRKYLSYFQPDYLFLNALPMVKMGVNGLGLMYLFQLPIFLIGIVKITKTNIEYKYLLLAWIFVGLLPAAITLVEHHTVRTLVIIPVFSIICGLGFLAILGGLSKFKNIYIKIPVIGVFLCFVFLNFLQAYLMFRVHFPIQQADTFMVGNKEAIQWVIEHENDYYEVIFDSKRSSGGQTIVSVPHLYYMFYKKYNPVLYQTELANPNRINSKVGKMMIRDINWRVDRIQEKVLFIGNPEVLPEKDLTDANIHKKIFLPDGTLALVIVSVGK